MTKNTEDHNDAVTAKVRALNDAFRQSITSDTAIMAGGTGTLAPEMQGRMLEAVRAFDAFTRDHDLWSEHEAGIVEVTQNDSGEVLRIFFKIDCLCPTCLMPTDDAADPGKVVRQITLMPADEY